MSAFTKESSGSCSPIRSIAVVGRDVDAWISALLLQLSLGNADKPVTITLVELPSRLTPGEVYPTLPSQQALHRLLRLDQQALLGACGGLLSMGYRYFGWAGSKSEFFMPFDTAGSALNGVAFIHYWARAWQRGLNIPLDAFSLCAASAKQGRYYSHEIDSERFSSGQLAGNLPAISYLQTIGRIALAAGIKHHVAELASVNIADGIDNTDGRIESLQLKNGETVTADLFIDASGDGELITQVEPEPAKYFEAAHFESWAHWFPCDQALVASVPALQPRPTFNQVNAFDAGWLGRYPLRAHTALFAPFSSAHTHADQVLEKVQHTAGTPQQPHLKPLIRGRRTNPWQANCVSVGTTATSLDPVQGIQLHLLHTSLSYLLTLIPTDSGCMRLEREIYNARLHDHSLRLRDFQLAHYALNGRREPFWQHCANAPRPDTLQHKIELFRTRGHIPLKESETFQEESWQLLFAGCGLVPVAWHPRAELMAEDEQIATFQRMLNSIAARAAQMPAPASASAGHSTTV
ncbi:tryptophan 7-halogenase [Microbulbifer sp.]|uniref:tryptophan 7-halogenase n=1 Tax=Microbulbifer sp. TaxID=1908541 RepID=UPI00258FC857|nr:tryptophan 7-halogenase [Microbulbifer sp.]